MNCTPESKRKYSSPALTPMTMEQATQFVARHGSSTEEALNSLKLLRLQAEGHQKYSARSNGNRSHLA